MKTNGKRISIVKWATKFNLEFGISFMILFFFEYTRKKCILEELLNSSEIKDMRKIR